MPAAYKFFNIGKANEEIDRLESLVASLTTQVETLKGNDSEIAAAAEKVKGELATASAKIVQLESDLGTARQTISTVTAARDKAETDLKEANAKLANPEQRIKEAASVHAAEITARLGQPPVVAAPTTAPGGNEAKTWAEKAVAAAEAKAAQRPN